MTIVIFAISFTVYLQKMTTTKHYFTLKQ